MKLLLRLLIVFVALAGLGGAALWWIAARPLVLPAPVVDFTVPRGHNLRQAANTIAAAGVPVDPRVLYWTARLAGKAEYIRAGSYEVHSGLTLWQLILKLSSGDVAQADLTVPEGWTFRQLRAAIEAHPLLTQDARDLSDEDILQRIGAAETHPEGLFFPDTYLFDKHSSALALYRRAYQAMQQVLQREWATRQADLPLASPYEALILASIIEKETGRPDERGLVASVFINRLRIGMRLQTDPTVIYGLGENFQGRLRRHHLDTDHPWNTYTRGGLPPTPIALPGRAALYAALHPTASDYFYFVARGDGSSAFSRDLAEHNRAVNLYQRGDKGS